MAVYSLIMGNILQSRPALRRTLILATFTFNFLAINALYYLPNSTSPSWLCYSVVVLYLLSVSFGLGTYYSGLMSLVVLVVPESKLGLGWGIIGAAISFSGALAPALYGAVISINEDKLGEGYRDTTLLATIFSAGSLVCAEYLYLYPFGIFDKTYNEIEEERASGLTQ